MKGAKMKQSFTIYFHEYVDAVVVEAEDAKGARAEAKKLRPWAKVRLIAHNGVALQIED